MAEIDDLRAEMTYEVSGCAIRARNEGFEEI
jgi:hypothetical protein